MTPISKYPYASSLCSFKFLFKCHSLSADFLPPYLEVVSDPHLGLRNPLPCSIFHILFCICSMFVHNVYPLQFSGQGIGLFLLMGEPQGYSAEEHVLRDMVATAR